jgi:hypothetical protein
MIRCNTRFFQLESWNDPLERPLTGRKARKGFWFRIFGKGLHVSNDPPNFSQRHGYTKYLNLPLGYKMTWLKYKLCKPNGH